VSTPLDILSLTRAGLAAEIGHLHGRPGKGVYHADAIFKTLYTTGVFDPESLPEFAGNPGLASRVREHLRLDLPDITGRQGDGDTYKFLLKLESTSGSTLETALETESVVIPMKHHKTLCVSSQVGCKMGCRFCETAQMGFLRNLTAGEIVAQAFTARHVLGEPIENIVFMGMGEPTDNLDAVITAIRILADQRGFGIPLRAITVSTVGSVPGILRLAEEARLPLQQGGLRGLRLAVSLNAPGDAIRSAIMPVNGMHDMAALKAAFLQWPLPRPDDFILAEYVLIAGINDSEEHAQLLADYLRDTPTCVNLIPYNPRHDSPYERPSPQRVSVFFRLLQDLGQYCRIRGTKGDGVMAACGQLGNRALSRKNSATRPHRTHSGNPVTASNTLEPA
jgi:23S rRNA (adenine2503-C2)-methyltransferase